MVLVDKSLNRRLLVVVLLLKYKGDVCLYFEIQDLPEQIDLTCRMLHCADGGYPIKL